MASCHYPSLSRTPESLPELCCVRRLKRLPAGAACGGQSCPRLVLCVGDTGDTRSHPVILPWCPATPPLPRVFCPSCFPSAPPSHKCWKSLALQKLPLFSSARNGSFCFPPEAAAPAVLPRPALLSVRSFPRRLHPRCFPREFPQGFQRRAVFGSEELPALHPQSGSARPLVTVSLILGDALPLPALPQRPEEEEEGEDGSGCSFGLGRSEGECPLQGAGTAPSPAATGCLCIPAMVWCFVYLC